MKKELQTQFEALVRERMSEFYAKAYMVAGNREEAESLTEDALVWAEGKFKGLANKARVIDLISERIGKGEHGGFETADEDAIFMRAMARVRSKENIRKLIGGVCGIVITAVVLAIAIPQIPFDAITPTEATTTATETDAEGKVILPVIGAVNMDKTYVVEGDDDVITLVNYHNLSSALGKKTPAKSAVMDIQTKLDRYVATATAPNGTAYMAFVDILQKDQNNPLTLYRMEKDGWKEIAFCEVQAHFGSNATMRNIYSSSRIYLETDADSNVYLFFLWENAITVCKYDAKTGEFIRSEEKIQTQYHPMAQYTFSTYYDASVGEKGAVYIGYVDNWKISFAYYDMAEDSFHYLTEKVGVVNDGKKIFCVSDGVIHMVAQHMNTNALTYFRIDTDGTVMEKVLQRPDSTWHSEAVTNMGSGGGGIEVDRNGNVHIVASRSSFDDKIQHQISHYIIDENGKFEQEILPKHCYTDTDGYLPQGIGVFKDDEGNVYYAEGYEQGFTSTINLIAVAKLNEKIGEDPILVDAIELPHNITTGFIRINGRTAVFFTGNYIYYFNLKGIGE